VLRAEYHTGDAFRREARAAAKLPHPNIVAVYDVRQDGNTQYIVMEYVEGQDLKGVIQASTPFRIGQALDMIIQVCEAVGFAHEKGIIHCDIKPQNVLVLSDSKVKVTDFGIARAFSDAPPEQRDKVWGTPYYVPPELISGTTLTPASDVYSIGVMLYEMLAGQPPFEGQSAAEITRQHVLNAPPPIHRYHPRVPRYVRQILDRTLAKDPASRYRSAKQLGRQLAAYRQHGEAATQPLQPLSASSVPTVKEDLAEQPATPAYTVSVTQPQQGIDWVMLLLAALAFLAVMGLLPLWGTVLTRALIQPTPMPTATAIRPNSATPTATSAIVIINTPIPLTPTPELQVTVPDLIGRELEEARRLVREKGLILTVTEQRFDSQVPASNIIAQNVTAGEQRQPTQSNRPRAGRRHHRYLEH
jgi:serine/threonine-protein kinase